MDSFDLIDYPIIELIYADPRASPVAEFDRVSSVLPHFVFDRLFLIITSVENHLEKLIGVFRNFGRFSF